MPTRSAGCATCKIRRVKCDETKPVCQRCTKARRTCVEANAAKQAGFSIHVENQYASGARKRPRGPRSGLTVQRPQLDLETRAVAYYLQYHLQTLTDKPSFTTGLPECVYAWKVSGRTDPMVDLALSCMALTVYARTQSHPPAAIEASERFYRLLPLVQQRPSEVGACPVNEADVDACLLSVFLLGRHSSATHNPEEPVSKDSFKSMRGWSHRDGSMALLKVWHDDEAHQLPSVIVKQTRRGLIKASLLRDLPLPDWFLDGESFGEHGLELGYDRLIVRIVNLHARFATMQLKGEMATPQVEELNAEAQNLDEALQKWAAEIPTKFAPQPHILEVQGLLPRRHFYSQKVHVFAKPGHVTLWSQYYAARMLLNSKLVKILGFTHPDRPFLLFTCAKQLQACIARSKEMGENLTANIPYLLECVKVDFSDSPGGQAVITLNETSETKPYLADLVIWPISVASCVEGVDDKLRKWCKSELAAIGHIVGDGLLQRAASDDWTSF